MKLPALLVSGLVMAFLGRAAPARAMIAERVVAVIGERPILWTELERRAVVARMQIRAQTRDPNVIAAQEQEMYKELLEHMIDDRLEEQQADRAHITVSSDEIERGIDNIAASAQAQLGHAVTVAEVLAEVSRRGMTEQDFRDEIRRQIVDGKMIELRVRPRVRVTETDGRAAYRRWAAQIDGQLPTVPSYDEVKDDMMERALIDALVRARKEWLRDLRRSADVDLRL
jgi:peptidyl-prolyl cis-trans isomerase SurA